MSDKAIEQEIQAKGLTAPRVTPTDVEAEIQHEDFIAVGDAIFPGADAVPSRYTTLSCMTICVLTLRNGFTVTGESACASPKNFDAEIGRKIARQNAVAKIWPLLGFRLRDQLAA